jgi:hypothetical protein
VVLLLLKQAERLAEMQNPVLPIPIPPVPVRNGLEKSAILKEEDNLVTALLPMIPGANKSGVQFSLLYCASKNGRSARQFHSCCDGHGPTVTLIRDGNGGLVFGAYTAVLWSSPSAMFPSSAFKFASHSSAFLFSLKNPHSILPVKLPIKMDQIESAIHRYFSRLALYGNVSHPHKTELLYENYKNDLLASLNSLLCMSLYDHYTDVTRRLKTGYFPKSHDCNTRKICDRYNFGPSVIRFCLNNPKQQFCGSNQRGDNHPGCWCGMHTHFNGAPEFTNGGNIKKAVDLISDNPDEIVKTMKIEELKKMIKRVKETTYSGPFKPYVNIHYMGQTLKFPSPKFTLCGAFSRLTDYYLDIFDVDVYYTKVESKLIEEIRISYKKEKVFVRRTEVGQIPTNENSIHETLIDLALGGIYACEGDSLNVFLRTWNHDGAQVIQTLSYAFPPVERHVGLCDSTIEVKISETKIKNVITILLDEFEKTDDFIPIMVSSILGERFTGETNRKQLNTEYEVWEIKNTDT